VKICDYLDLHLIAFLKNSSRNEALQALIELLYKEGKIKNEKAFYKAILDREKLSSTGIGMGVALPHAQREDLDNFFIAIGIQEEKGIEWQALDKLSVRLIFLIGGPTNKQSEYLQLLSQLTRLLKDDEMRKSLIHAKSKEEVFKLFCTKS
jgi:nitrogen PTS system EIIA component